METLYSIDECGLSGNEDMGSMSAWYLFTLGFYPVTPGQPIYTITSPLFEKAVINLDAYYDNRKFIIRSKNVSGDNKYIQSATLKGEKLTRPWIIHDEIVSGDTLEFVMGSYPNYDLGSSSEAASPSISME